MFSFLKYFEYFCIIDYLIFIELFSNQLYMIFHLLKWLWAHEFTYHLSIITKLSDCICKFLFLIGCPEEVLIFSFITFSIAGEVPHDGQTTSSFYMLDNFLIVFPVLIQCPLKSLNFIRFPVYWILPWHRLFLVVLSWLNLPGQFGTSLSLFWLIKD